MKSRFYIGVLFIFLFASSAANAQDKTRSEIENLNKKFSDAFSKGDSLAISNMYAENARAFPPNGAMTEGRQNIQDLWKGAISSGLSKLELKTWEVEKSGNTAFETGTYTMYGADGKAVDDGKYIVIWKKIGKNWFLYRDIWNSSRKM